jgi:hypothetical protein
VQQGISSTLTSKPIRSSGSSGHGSKAWSTPRESFPFGTQQGLSQPQGVAATIRGRSPNLFLPARITCSKLWKQRVVATMRHGNLELTPTAVVLKVTSLLVIAGSVAWILIDDIRRGQPVAGAAEPPVQIQPAVLDASPTSGSAFGNSTESMRSH